MGALDTLLKTRNVTVTTNKKKSALDDLLNKGNQRKSPVTKTLPDSVGGGAYYSVPGQPDVLVKGDRDYAGVPAVSTSERHHIIPIEFGGSSETDKNIRALPQDAHDRITEKEKKVSNDYKNKKISLGNARLQLMTALQTELDLQQGVKQGTAANFLSGLKDAISHPIQSFKKIVELNPATTQAVKDVYDAPKTTLLDIPKAVPDFINEIVRAEKEGGDRIADVFVTKTNTKSEKAGQILKAVSGTAGVIFSPITAAFSASKNVPILGGIASLVNLPFAIVGDTLTNLSNEGLNALVSSGKIKEDTANNIRQGVNEISALTGQIVLGGKMFKGRDAKIKELETKYGKKDAETIVKKAEERAQAEMKMNDVMPKTEVAETQQGALDKLLAERQVTAKDPVITTALEDYVFYNKKKSLTENVINKVDKLNIKPTEKITLYRDGDVDTTVLQSWSKNPNISDNPVSKAFSPKQILIDFTDPKAKELFSDIGKESLSKYNALESEVLVKPSITVKPVKPVVENYPEIKTSKLAKGVEEKAIEQKLVDSFGDLPEYATVNVKEQAKASAELVKNRLNDAIEIARGNKLPPEGLLPESVFTAVEQHAIKNKDISLLHDLATSDLTTQATGMGQRIRMLAERNPNSPVSRLQEVKKARETKAGKSLEQKKTIKKQLKEETNKMNLSKEDLSWDKFLNEIKC